MLTTTWHIKCIEIFPTVDYEHEIYMLSDFEEDEEVWTAAQTFSMQKNNTQSRDEKCLWITIFYFSSIRKSQQPTTRSAVSCFAQKCIYCMHIAHLYALSLALYIIFVFSLYLNAFFALSTIAFTQRVRLCHFSLLKLNFHFTAFYSKFALKGLFVHTRAAFIIENVWIWILMHEKRKRTTRWQPTKKNRRRIHLFQWHCKSKHFTPRWGVDEYNDDAFTNSWECEHNKVLRSKRNYSRKFFFHRKNEEF